MQTPSSPQQAPSAIFKKRSKKPTSARKRVVTPPPATASDSDFTSSEDEQGRQVKRRRTAGGLTAKSTAPAKYIQDDHPVSNTASAHPQLNDATKSTTWFDEKHLTNSKDQASESAAGQHSNPGGYKGLSKYQSFIQKNPDAPSRQVGPVKTSSNVRTITVTDFAPDVCKDYKQTGFCGFGDSCKFLHAREDYKQGWQLDRDWEIGSKGKKTQGKTMASADRSLRNSNGNDEDADDAMLEKIPFACIICKASYKTPIITKCGHYFCEACALQRYRKHPSCAACGASTGGVFNVAKKLSKLLEKKKERVDKRKENASDSEELSSVANGDR